MYNNNNNNIIGIAYMENLDLDINNYNIRDLETFFKLKPNSKYSAGDIELKE